MHTPHPAKVYLMGYLSLRRRRDALLDELDRAREAASRATSRLTAVRLSGTPRRDSMADAILRVADGEERLRALLEELDAQLARILATIERVPDERHRALLTMRYVSGWGWDRIARKMMYDRRQVFRLHGEALEVVRKDVT